jgi:hypothetical protein
VLVMDETGATRRVEWRIEEEIDNTLRAERLKGPLPTLTMRGEGGARILEKLGRPNPRTKNEPLCCARVAGCSGLNGKA